MDVKENLDGSITVSCHGESVTLWRATTKKPTSRRKKTPKPVGPKPTSPPVLPDPGTTSCWLIQPIRSGRKSSLPFTDWDLLEVRTGASPTRSRKSPALLVHVPPGKSVDIEKLRSRLAIPARIKFEI